LVSFSESNALNILVGVLGSNITYEYLNLLSAYTKQDLNALIEMEEMTDTIFLQKFLEQRNKNWIHRLIELFNEKSTFVAVGAAHLAGENGVLQLLRNQGYTVTSVCPKK
jgi:uncharacterized protein YbaP (TraB family)